MRTRLRPLVPLAALLALACDDDPVAPGGGNPPPAPIVWDYLRGGIGVDEIRSVWGTSAQHILLLHADGIIRFDGTDWNALGLPALNAELNALWGASTSTVFVVGDGGTLLRGSGSSWTTLTSPTLRDVNDVSGVSATEVFAVASTGAFDAELLRYDGVSWGSLYNRMGARGNAVCAVPGMAFVVCDDGVVFRHDGNRIHEDDTAVGEDLFDVWAASASDAYAVGEAGRILRWDGAAWTPMTSGVGSALHAVAGASASDVDACGDGGLMLHFDGTDWLPVPTGTTASLSAVEILSAGNRAAGGDLGTVVFGAGGQWAPRRLGQPFTLESVWSTSSYYIAVGTGPAGGVIRDRDGFAWSVPEGLHGVSGFDTQNVQAVGDGGVIYLYDGLTWEKQDSPTSKTLRGMTALVSRFGNPFRIYAVGDNGTLLKWVNGVWGLATLPAGAEGHMLVDVWAAAIDDVFAVASNATSILRYDDPYELADWTLEITPATSNLLAVGGWRGDVYIASESGEIFFNDGGDWQPMPSPVTTALRDMRAIAENSIFAVGDAGVILHFDGVSWRRTDSGFFGDFHGVWGAEDRALFAVGVQGAVVIHSD